GRAVEPEDAHLWAAARAGAGDDLLLAIAVDVARGHADAAEEPGGIGEEPADGHAVGPEDAHLGPATLAGAGDDLVADGAVDVATGDGDASGEGRVVREEPS